MTKLLHWIGSGLALGVLMGAFGFPELAQATTYHCGNEEWRTGGLDATYERVTFTVLPGATRFISPPNQNARQREKWDCQNAFEIAEEVVHPEPPYDENDWHVHFHFNHPMNGRGSLATYRCTEHEEDVVDPNVSGFVCTAHGRFASRVTFSALLQFI